MNDHARAIEHRFEFRLIESSKPLNHFADDIIRNRADSINARNSSSERFKFHLNDRFDRPFFERAASFPIGL